jgi:hypothetical protein
LIFGLSPSAIVFLSLSVVCAVITELLIHREIEEVNQSLSNGEPISHSLLISYSFMYPGKMARIKEEYRRLHPKGKLEIWRVTIQTSMFVFLFLTAIAVGFFK